MIRRNRDALVLLGGLTLVSCKADDGLTYATIPTNVPEVLHPDVSYQLTQGAIQDTVVTTNVVATEGVIPGVTCYVEPSTVPPQPMVNLSSDNLGTTTCEVVQTNAGFQGRVRVPASYVNKYGLSILLFWVKQGGLGEWDY